MRWWEGEKAVGGWLGGNAGGLLALREKRRRGCGTARHAQYVCPETTMRPRSARRHAHSPLEHLGERIVRDGVILLQMLHKPHLPFPAAAHRGAAQHTRVSARLLMSADGACRGSEGSTGVTAASGFQLQSSSVRPLSEPVAEVGGEESAGPEGERCEERLGESRRTRSSSGRRASARASRC